MRVSPAPSLESAFPVGAADRKTGAGLASLVSAGRVDARVVPIIGLTLILLFAAFLRLYGLDREGYWGDEYAQVQLYGLPLHHTCWFALTRHAFGPPDFVIGWLLYRLDPSVWMCRLPSAAWGVVCIGACFFLVRRLASWREGLVAGALLSVCRMHLVLSQEVRPYSICLAFILLTLFLFLWVMERPTWRRVLTFALVAYISTLTRSFTPLVFLLVIGMTLTVVIMAQRFAGDRASAPVSEEAMRERRGSRRLWIATLLVGLATLPMVLLLISLDRQAAFSSAFIPNGYGIDPRFSSKLTTYVGVACTALWDNYGPFVLGLAVAGLLIGLRRRRELPLSTRCMLAIMLTVGPAFLLIYSLVGGVHYLYDRYNFYLMPIVAALASLAVVPLLRRVRRTLAHNAGLRWSAFCLIMAVALVYPGAMSAEELGSHRRRDWRGCATYLAHKVTPDDVIMVLTDEPFGRVQHRFFGKYEWPVERRPLAESMWTLGVSDAHFDRLSRQTGRCYTVMAYPVEPQGEHSFRSRGLQEPPAGYQLAKFRGLDLLIPEVTAEDTMEEVAAICDDLLLLPLTDKSTKVIPLVLKARTELHLGLIERAERDFSWAAELVPQIQVEYFAHATAQWAKCLRDSGS